MNGNCIARFVDNGRFSIGIAWQDGDGSGPAVLLVEDHHDFHVAATDIGHLVFIQHDCQDIQEQDFRIRRYIISKCCGKG